MSTVQRAHRQQKAAGRPELHFSVLIFGVHGLNILQRRYERLTCGGLDEVSPMEFCCGDWDGLIAGAAWLVFVQNDNARRTKASYTKYEYRVAMRDGTTLFTQVYVPKA